jgi:hypothetical protein
MAFGPANACTPLPAPRIGVTGPDTSNVARRPAGWIRSTHPRRTPRRPAAPPSGRSPAGRPAPERQPRRMNRRAASAARLGPTPTTRPRTATSGAAPGTPHRQPAPHRPPPARPAPSRAPRRAPEPVATSGDAPTDPNPSPPRIPPSTWRRSIPFHWPATRPGAAKCRRQELAGFRPRPPSVDPVLRAGSPAPRPPAANTSADRQLCAMFWASCRGRRTHELDLTAARTDRLVLATVKSIFGSRGVVADHVTGTTSSFVESRMLGQRARPVREAGRRDEPAETLVPRCGPTSQPRVPATMNHYRAAGKPLTYCRLLA